MHFSRATRRPGGGRPSRLRELTGLLLIALALFLSLALLSFHPGDPSFSRSLSASHRVRNLVGVAGAYGADLLGQTFGMGALALPLLLVWASLRTFAGLPPLRLGLRFLGWGLAYMAASGLLHLALEADPYFGILPGGLAGYLAAAGLGIYLNLWGAYLVLGTTLVLLLVALTGASPSRLLWELLRVPAGAIRTLGRGLAGGGRGLDGFFANLRSGLRWPTLPAISLPWRSRGAEGLPEEEALRTPLLSLEHLASVGEDEGEREQAPSLPSLEELRSAEKLAGAKANVSPEEEGALPSFGGPTARAGDAPGLAPGRFDLPLPEEEEKLPLSHGDGPAQVRNSELARLSAPPRRRRTREYRLPPLDLFQDPPAERPALNDRVLAHNAALLEKALLDYGVAGKVVEVKAGPLVTMYEFAPASGVKVSKIAGLSDDLALAMRALSVRIVAPIPGKAVVGIELPNPHRQSVVLKEVLASPEFQASPAKLTIAVGRDILGRPAVTVLTQIPHLLIAGATGSGKSVALNAMVCSLLCRATPKEVKFLMVDPKMLELSAYDGIPHLLVPVVTHPKKAAAALRGVVAEMERRYQVLAEKGVRNIEGYNDLVAMELGPERARRAWLVPRGEEGGEGGFLPYVVVVIDELADLMMVSSKEVEDSLIRLAQMARAAGIHLLVATQRPSVDVLTGLIKANFPARISLKVSSRVDSRTILDANGAERLLGRGDLLFLAPGSSALRRIHAPFVTEKEVAKVAEWWRQQGEPSYDESLLAPAAVSSAAEEEEGEVDGRYEEAVRLVARAREASISLLQRHLRVGYNRAARMIERMEREGLVGPSDGIRRREVYVKEVPEG